MKEPKCWKCKYFIPCNDEQLGIFDSVQIGYCELTGITHSVYDHICEHFIQNPALTINT